MLNHIQNALYTFDRNTMGNMQIMSKKPLEQKL